MSSGCFKIKSNMLTLSIMELHRYHPRDFLSQLHETVKQSPKFFEQNPIIVSLEKLSGPSETPDLQALVADCKEAGVQVIAFRGSNAFRGVVTDAGYALILAAASARSGEEKEIKSVERPAVVDMQLQQPEYDGVAKPGMLIVQPVRSGQRIYAQGTDLIVLSTVSGGAEILADGNIHVYGPLRGRAIAGASGDTNARIFCQQLLAELLSIAGSIIVNEDMQGPRWGQSVQAYLEGDAVKLALL
jgi:septum site-determining protein MinC